VRLGGVVAAAMPVEERQVPVRLGSHRRFAQDPLERNRRTRVLPAPQVRDGTFEQAPRARLLAVDGTRAHRRVAERTLPERFELARIGATVGIARRPFVRARVVREVRHPLRVDVDECLVRGEQEERHGRSDGQAEGEEGAEAAHPGPLRKGSATA